MKDVNNELLLFELEASLSSSFSKEQKEMSTINYEHGASQKGSYRHSMFISPPKPEEDRDENEFRIDVSTNPSPETKTKDLIIKEFDMDSDVKLRSEEELSSQDTTCYEVITDPLIDAEVVDAPSKTKFRKAQERKRKQVKTVKIAMKQAGYIRNKERIEPLIGWLNELASLFPEHYNLLSRKIKWFPSIDQLHVSYVSNIAVLDDIIEGLTSIKSYIIESRPDDPEFNRLSITITQWISDIEFIDYAKYCNDRFIDVTLDSLPGLLEDYSEDTEHLSEYTRILPFLPNGEPVTLSEYDLPKQVKESNRDDRIEAILGWCIEYQFSPEGAAELLDTARRLALNTHNHKLASKANDYIKHLNQRIKDSRFYSNKSKEYNKIVEEYAKGFEDKSVPYDKTMDRSKRNHERKIARTNRIKDEELNAWSYITDPDNISACCKRAILNAGISDPNNPRREKLRKRRTKPEVFTVIVDRVTYLLHNIHEWYPQYHEPRLATGKDGKERLLTPSHLIDRCIHNCVMSYYDYYITSRLHDHTHQSIKGRGIYSMVKSIKKHIIKVKGSEQSTAKADRVYPSKYNNKSRVYTDHKGNPVKIDPKKRKGRAYDTDVWGVSLDIKKFYPSIDHELALLTIEKYIKNPMTRIFYKNLLRSNPSVVFADGTPVGRGVPLGNNTSQSIANLYLNTLGNEFMKKFQSKSRITTVDANNGNRRKNPDAKSHMMTVDKRVYFDIYADDIVLISNSRNSIEEAIRWIAKELDKLKLSLKVKYPNSKDNPYGITKITNETPIITMGYKFYRDYIEVRDNILKSLDSKVHTFNKLLVNRDKHIDINGVSDYNTKMTLLLRGIVSLVAFCRYSTSLKILTSPNTRGKGYLNAMEIYNQYLVQRRDFRFPTVVDRVWATRNAINNIIRGVKNQLVSNPQLLEDTSSKFSNGYSSVNGFIESEIDTLTTRDVLRILTLADKEKLRRYIEYYSLALAHNMLPEYKHRRATGEYNRISKRYSKILARILLENL